MDLKKRTLSLAAIALLTLAAPAFAGNYGSGSNAMNDADANLPVAHLTVVIPAWNGGGSNATVATAAGSDLPASVAAQTASWNGGGSNAMDDAQTFAAVSRTLHFAAGVPSSPWDGGGSNATVATALSAASVKIAASSAAGQWNGGGSNAMTAGAAQVSCTPVAAQISEAFKALKTSAGGSNRMSGDSSFLACADLTGNAATLN